MNAAEALRLRIAPGCRAGAGPFGRGLHLIQTLGKSRQLLRGRLVRRLHLMTQRIDLLRDRCIRRLEACGQALQISGDVGHRRFHVRHVRRQLRLDIGCRRRLKAGVHRLQVMRDVADGGY